MNIMKNKPVLIVGGLAALAVLGWLAFGFFGIQAAFIDNEVNEDGPVFTAAVEPTETEQDAVAATEEFQNAMAEAEQLESRRRARR